MLLSKIQKVTKRSINNSFLLIYRNNKLFCSGILTKQKSRLFKNFYRIGEKRFILVENKNKENAVDLFYLVNDKRKCKVDFYVDVYRTRVYKKRLKFLKKRREEIKSAYEKLRKIYGNQQDVWIINKNTGKYYKLNMLDAFFIGNENYDIELDGKRYKADYFVIEANELVRTLVKDYQSFVDFYFLLELFEQTPVYFRKSDLYNLLTKLKKKMKQIHRRKIK